MIRQLRKKFIVVAMCSIFAVLVVIVGILNAADYYGIVKRADGILEMLSENDGRFPDDYPQHYPNRRKPDVGPGMDRFDWKMPPMFEGMTEETPYETRFFWVRFDKAGEVLSVDTGRIAAVKTSDAIAYAGEIRASGRQKGFYENYRFLQTAQGGINSVIFMDCGKDLDSFKNLAAASVAVSFAGMFSVFLLVFVFSRRVFRPVEESYAKQKRFVTDAGHELKTPLTIIAADVDLLEMEGEPNEWTAGIRRQVERLSNLTEQMVTLSRMDEENDRSASAKNTFRECCLSALVSETASMFEPLVHAGGKSLVLEVKEDVFCQGDEEKLRQMLSLLLDNAMKYSAKEGTILLKLEPKQEVPSRKKRAVLTVRNTLDEGSGISPGGQDKLFERFYRPDASRSSKTGGSGIGLSIVKSIVELHRGKITAYSEDGRSIDFVVTL